MDQQITKQIGEAMEFIKSRLDRKVKAAIVLGSGLGQFTSRIQKQTIIPYSEIPHFNQTSVEGHSGQIVAGEVQGVPVVALQGRWHYYEGHTMNSIVLPIRTMCMLGVENIVLTNAAGGINLNFKAGDLMLINDHVNLMGDNPLKGKEPATFGPRFPDMTRTYCDTCIEVLKKNAQKLNFKLQEGVYGALQGPTYETPAEVRMLRTLGLDAVGMSTVPEAIAAKHLGARVMGISCITNMAAGIQDVKLTHEEVQVEAQKVVGQFSDLLENSLAEICNK